MDMDQVELDAAYDQAFYAPLRLEIIKRLASTSEAVRSRIGQPIRESYGPTEVEKLDVFRAKRANAPIFVFIHGGAWLVTQPPDATRSSAWGLKEVWNVCGNGRAFHSPRCC